MTAGADIATVDGPLLAEAVQLAASTSGMRANAVQVEPVARLLRARLDAGASVATLMRDLRDRSEGITRALHAAVTVRETYFFRQPEQFDLVARLDVPEDRPIRAWSAACATGEEAYSLAAALRSRGRAQGAQVLGTDLVEQNVAVARAGVYGPHSVRVSGPLIFPVFDRARDGDEFVVDAALRKMASFEVHNLLDPPPEGEFDVIFCRNALLYFQPDAVRQVCHNLAQALAPEGLLVFGPLDLPATPRGLASVGAAGAQVFTHQESLSRIRIQTDAGQRRVSASLIQVAAAAGASVRHGVPHGAAHPVSMHTHVLECLDRGDLAGARAGLDALEASAPQYLPGMMERALWHRRRGEHARSRELLRRVSEIASTLGAESMVDGPEPLPAGFYATSAATLLQGRAG